MLRLGLAMALLLAIASRARAEEQPTYRAIRPTVACVNPRATLALTNRSDPRQADPRWIAYVMNDGRCMRVDSGSLWTLGTRDGALALAQPAGGGSSLYVTFSDLTEAPTLAASTAVSNPADAVTHVLAGSWQATDFHAADNPGCSIGGDAIAPGVD